MVLGWVVAIENGTGGLVVVDTAMMALSSSDANVSVAAVDVVPDLPSSLPPVS